MISSSDGRLLLSNVHTRCAVPKAIDSLRVSVVERQREQVSSRTFNSRSIMEMRVTAALTFFSENITRKERSELEKPG